jgi:hypothetical protein
MMIGRGVARAFVIKVRERKVPLVTKEGE